ncbi:MAG: thiamine pyrophosphate-dependent enzyme, partial [Clostridiales bacterium]|nr:thiamine pyrophosphate-dependent enzyme [Clostridiales bacterium]
EMDKNVPSEYNLTGDLKHVLERLEQELPQAGHAAWKEEIGSWKRRAAMPDIPGYVTPQKLVEAVHDRLDAEDIVVTDVGQHQMWVAQYYQFTKPRTFVSSGGLGTMGFSMGAGIGASFGRPEQRVVVFAGDGGFHMNLNELATVASYQIPVVIIVMNNNALGMVRQWQKIFYQNRFSATSPGRITQFTKVADAFGVPSLKLEDNGAIASVLDQAFSMGGPVLVEANVSPDANVLPMIPSGGAHTDTIEKL